MNEGRGLQIVIVVLLLINIALTAFMMVGAQKAQSEAAAMKAQMAEATAGIEKLKSVMEKLPQPNVPSPPHP